MKLGLALFSRKNENFLNEAFRYCQNKVPNQFPIYVMKYAYGSGNLSLYDLFTGIWSSDEQMHGPVVLGISLWLLHRNWGAMELAAQGKPTSNWGWPVFILGLLLYALGRSQRHFDV